MATHGTSEPALEAEVKKEIKTFERRALMIAAALVVLIGGGMATFAYLAVSSSQVYIDKAVIQAPEVDLAPTQGGIVRNVFVTEGETIPPNTVVAQVGDELVKSAAGGLVISAANDIGESVAPGTPVVKVIDPSELRVVGQVDENKGLSSIHVGDTAKFTVDAYGGQSFTGVVSEVSPTSHASGVVFDISNERSTQSFDIKISYDPSKDPQFRNGMSARIWIYTK